VIAATVIAGLFLLGLGLWVGAAAYVWSDASARRIPSAPWWALGTLLAGPMALIAYLIDRPKSAVTKCTFCTRPILAADRTCPYCGREQPGLPEPRDRA
jgi:hypothetical protein